MNQSTKTQKIDKLAVLNESGTLKTQSTVFIKQ